MNIVKATNFFHVVSSPFYAKSTKIFAIDSIGSRAKWSPSISE